MSSFDQATSSLGFQTEAVVKWFNLTKGFGFVAPSDGSSDAFMHTSVVIKAGLRDIMEGTRLLVQIADGPKGRQVTNIIQVLGITELPQNMDPNNFTLPVVEMIGIVKWFKADKGFGFVTPDDGDKDVFIHRSVIIRAGIQNLESGQRVKMRVQSATKGYEAVWIELMTI